MTETETAESTLQAKLDSLHAPEWDSSSSEDDGDEEEAAFKEMRESADKHSRDSNKKNNKQSGRLAANASSSSNVLYIGHLPTAFEEREITQFLKQFGKVLNVRVSRSKKTGNSRGYAFCQMQTPQVAAIVADTLSGYILFGQKRLVCHVVPTNKIHKRLFYQRQPPAKQPKQPPDRSLQRIKHITERLVEREQKKRKALKELGIDYDFPGYEACEEKVEKDASQEEVVKSKQKGSVDSTTDSKTSKKKRKDSLGSVECSADSTEKKEKKRKDSLASVDSTHLDGSAKKKQRRRKESDASASASIADVDASSDPISTPNDSKKKKKKKLKKMTTPSQESAGKSALPKGSQSEKKEKKKKSKKTKKRRTSAP